jgi:hypothetical protein
MNQTIQDSFNSNDLSEIALDLKIHEKKRPNKITES